MLMANRRARVAARGSTRRSPDNGFQRHMIVTMRLFLSFFDGMVNENLVKSEIKCNIVYVFKDTELKLNVKFRKYTDIYNDSKEIVS